MKTAKPSNSKSIKKVVKAASKKSYNVEKGQKRGKIKKGRKK